MATKEELDTLIKAKGDEIRQLKADKAAKEVIMAQVTGLNELKAQYKQVTGEDYGPPPAPDKKKKEPKAEDAAAAGGPKIDPRKAAKEARAAKRASGGAAAPALGSPPSATAPDATTTATAAAAPATAAAATGEQGEKYGILPLIQSQVMTDKVWARITDLSPKRAGQRVLLRGRVHTSRAVGKGVFLLLRQGIATVQAVVYQGANVSKGMVKFAGGVSKESVVDLVGILTSPREPVESATAKLVEVQVEEMYVVSAAENVLPFQLEDASRPDPVEGEENVDMPGVGMDNRLNFRWIDTRTAANQAIFRIQHGVSQLFREFLTERGFIEIHTPKLLGGASESGSSVFALNYFDQQACLAQSPQLYKQMACACGGFEKVFEIGPVFRAEKSFTHRHLCEFTGLDFEMAIHEHYYEVLELFSDLFIFIFDNLTSRFATELEAVNKQHPFEPLQFCRPSLRLSFAEGVALLREAGFEASENEDLDTEKEKALGRIVKEKYKTDFYMMDRYPLSVRPFYTMPCPDDPTLSNSYDMFIRGEEIVSGAQRIHDVELLGQRIDAMGVPRETLRTYIDAFRQGALPHGGGGIGLERVVMLYLGLKNIRKTSLFPRDPKRLAP